MASWQGADGNEPDYRLVAQPAAWVQRGEVSFPPQSTLSPCLSVFPSASSKLVYPVLPVGRYRLA